MKKSDLDKAREYKKNIDYMIDPDNENMALHYEAHISKLEKELQNRDNKIRALQKVYRRDKKKIKKLEIIIDKYKQNQESILSVKDYAVEKNQKLQAENKEFKAKDNYIKLQYPTRQDMRNEIAKLEKENKELKEQFNKIMQLDNNFETECPNCGDITSDDIQRKQICIICDQVLE